MIGKVEFGMWKASSVINDLQDEINDTLMKMADELHGKTKSEGNPIVEKYKAAVPTKIKDLSGDP